jgi:hypothetical protein
VLLSAGVASELLHAIVQCIQITCSNAVITYRNWYVRKYNYNICREVTIVCMAVEVVTGTLLHTKPVCAINLETQFVLRFGVSYFMAES